MIWGLVPAIVRAPMNQLAPKSPCLASIYMDFPCLSSYTIMNLGSFIISSGLFHYKFLRIDPQEGKLAASS